PVSLIYMPYSSLFRSSFVIAFGDAELPVEHRGDPPELFDSEIPVIIEGAFDGDEFRSDKILIKHDSTYEEENDARLREAERDAEDRKSTRLNSSHVKI